MAVFNEAGLTTIGLYKDAIEGCVLARRYDTAEKLKVELAEFILPFDPGA